VPAVAIVGNDRSRHLRCEVILSSWSESAVGQGIVHVKAMEHGCLLAVVDASPLGR